MVVNFSGVQALTGASDAAASESEDELESSPDIEHDQNISPRPCCKRHF